MKIKIEIKNRFTGKIIFEFEKENNTIAQTVYESLKSGANLTGANLRDANLTGANLRDADLTDANLRGANLTDANLRDADLTGANLRGANLTDANLRDADLTGANLRGANLRDADLTDANLTGANLRGANLTDANLTGANLLHYKSDLWRVLIMNKNEISGLKKAMVDGKIDGTKYVGECACLKGTIANVAGLNILNIKTLIKNVDEPSEQWFMQFKEGHTPENYSSMKLTYEWIEELEGYLKN